MTRHSTADTIAIRPAAEADRPALEAVVAQACATTRYAEVASYAIRMAFERQTNESRAIVAASGGGIIGIALFGEIAGTMGTGRLHFIWVDAGRQRRGVGALLCQAAVEDLAGRGLRSVAAEMPDDPVFASGRELLRQAGFVEVAKVADYYADGIALLVLERALARM